MEVRQLTWELDGSTALGVVAVDLTSLDAGYRRTGKWVRSPVWGVWVKTASLASLGSSRSPFAFSVQPMQMIRLQPALATALLRQVYCCRSSRENLKSNRPHQTLVVRYLRKILLNSIDQSGRRLLGHRGTQSGLLILNQ